MDVTAYSRVRARAVSRVARDRVPGARRRRSRGTSRTCTANGGFRILLRPMARS